MKNVFKFVKFNSIRRYSSFTSHHLAKLASYPSLKDSAKNVEIKRNQLKELLNLSLKDDELGELARQDVKSMEIDLEQAEQDLMDQLMSDKYPNLNQKQEVILEIRSGAGGVSATLLSQVYKRMIERYALELNWTMDTLSIQGQQQMGSKSGFREGIFAIQGLGTLDKLSLEEGVHRWQWVPDNSTKMQTQTISIAVLPMIKLNQIKLVESDLKVETMKASGAGGQSVNTTDSAVRITHLPSGVSVNISTERSQHENKRRAMDILSARLYRIEEEKTLESTNLSRKMVVGGQHRHEKIRTYNLPAQRLVDERLDRTIMAKEFQQVMDGQLQQLHYELLCRQILNEIE